MKTRDFINLASLIGFSALMLLSLIIHALTFTGYDPREMSTYLWNGLQLSSAFALIVALIVFGLKGRISPLPASWSLDQVLVLGFVLFVFYGCFNFLFTDMILLRGGSPEIVNGHYAIGSHGFLTPITKEEFLKYKVYEARLHSGHWMAFFSFAIVALRWKARNRGGD
jgi:hypothetical protein